MLTRPAIAKPRSEWITHCIWHCGACDRHFVSVAGFDCHRQGDQGARYCAEPEGLMTTMPVGHPVVRQQRPLLQQVTPNGSCTLQKGCRREGQVIKTLTPVIIWTEATS